MSFAPSRALGFFIIDDLMAVAGAVKGITSIAGAASNLFDPNKSQDEKRLARAQFFQQSAIAGSVTAARYILGGLQNVASHEQPYYQAAWQAVSQQAADIAAEATAQGAKWNTSDVAGDQSKSAMISDVNADLASLGKIAASQSGSSSLVTTSSSGTTPTSTAVAARPLMLPAMTTNAPYNWTPVIAAAGIGLGVMALAGGSGGRRGRR